MESEILTTLEYQLCLPTAHTFLCRYLKAAHADRSMVQLACYLAERSLQEYSMLPFLPSTIAATAVMVARKSLQRHAWSPTLLHYTHYDEVHLQECAAQLCAVLNTPAGKEQAVYCKYSNARFGRVARLPLIY